MKWCGLKLELYQVSCCGDYQWARSDGVGQGADELNRNCGRQRVLLNGQIRVLLALVEHHLFDHRAGLVILIRLHALAKILVDTTIPEGRFWGASSMGLIYLSSILPTSPGIISFMTSVLLLTSSRDQFSDMCWLVTSCLIEVRKPSCLKKPISYKKAGQQTSRDSPKTCTCHGLGDIYTKLINVIN